MSKKDELNKRIKGLNNILTQTIQLRDYIIKYHEIKKEFLDLDPYFRFNIFESIRCQFHINKSMLVINLYKLCDQKSKESYCLKKIHNCLIGEFRNQISFKNEDKEKLKDILNYLKVNSVLIEKISTQRSQSYAHSDINITKQLADSTSIEWHEIYELIDKICEFTRIIKLELLNEKSLRKENFDYYKDHILYYKEASGYSWPDTDIHDISILLEHVMDSIRD